MQAFPSDILTWFPAFGLVKRFFLPVPTWPHRLIIQLNECKWCSLDMIGVPLLSKFQTTAAERFSILRKYSCEIETCESRHHASPHRLLNVFSHLLATAIPLMDTVIVQICVGVTVATGEASLITSRRTRANLGSVRELQNVMPVCENKKEGDSLNVTSYQAVLLLCSDAERSNS